ncbi:hypothetical protein J5N97_028370 [Dioscorea zingiberensis]|uniref:CASP-like protein n=1 Tax=Dioscorea zingiberensis TaxID=325984 RepID=A0A9D5BYV7_9LILI|nr:hypothetical protein J5N97_028370 [Dioscorea zingiberensis]
MGVENNVNGNNRITAWMMMMMAKGEVMIRIAALIATIVATLVMGLNKESKSARVAVVGTTPIFQTITAQFQDTPAFIYFVIANGIASGYNLVVLSLRLFSKSWASNIAVHLLDLVILGLVESGAGAAASMAELGKNGNMAARWSPICNNFHTFCTRGGLAIVASSIGALLLLILTMLSIITLHNVINAANKPQVVAP